MKNLIGRLIGRFLKNRLKKEHLIEERGIRVWIDDKLIFITEAMTIHNVVQFEGGPGCAYIKTSPDSDKSITICI